MAKVDTTYWTKIELIPYQTPPRRRTIQWRITPGSGTVLVRFWGSLTEATVIGGPAPDVAEDITEMLTGALNIVFDTTEGITDYWLTDPEGDLNSYNYLWAEFVLDTGGANDADFSDPDENNTRKDWY